MINPRRGIHPLLFVWLRTGRPFACCSLAMEDPHVASSSDESVVNADNRCEAEDERQIILNHWICQPAQWEHSWQPRSLTLHGSVLQASTDSGSGHFPAEEPLALGHRGKGQGRKQRDGRYRAVKG